MLSNRYSCHIFSEDFRKNRETPHFMKIRPVKTKLLLEDRRMEGRTGRHDEASNRFFEILQTRQSLEPNIIKIVFTDLIMM